MKGPLPGSKPLDQPPHPNAQAPSDFHQVIDGRGFHSLFNPANEDRGEVGFLRELLLTESCLFPFGRKISSGLDGIRRSKLKDRPPRHANEFKGPS